MNRAGSLWRVPARKRSLEFRWLSAAGLVFFAIGAWRQQGPLFTLGCLGVAALIAGGWYLIWKRTADRRPERPSKD